MLSKDQGKGASIPSYTDANDARLLLRPKEPDFEAGAVDPKS
jgi:hypothetical protein